jgi:hypothetical protein
MKQPVKRHARRNIRQSHITTVAVVWEISRMTVVGWMARMMSHIRLVFRMLALVVLDRTDPVALSKLSSATEIALHWLDVVGDAVLGIATHHLEDVPIPDLVGKSVGLCDPHELAFVVWSWKFFTHGISG